MWEKKYLNPEYRKAMEPDYKVAQPCPDVFWFPLTTPKFGWDLIEEMENFGQWSGGGHQVSK